MYHSVSETSHPLQTEEQEIGIDPLQSYLNKPGAGGSNENGSTHHTSDSDGTFISYRKRLATLLELGAQHLDDKLSVGQEGLPCPGNSTQDNEKVNDLPLRAKNFRSVGGIQTRKP